MKSISFSILLLLITISFACVIGSSGIDFSTEMVLNIRLPRVLTALFAGSATAAAGALSQALFRNPLATPSIIGTEAGAAFALAVATLWTASLQVPLETINPIFYTTIGAATATMISLALVRYRTSTPIIGGDGLGRLLLGGFALNALLAAGTSLCISILMEKGDGMNLYHWLMGSFSARTWNHTLGIFVVFSVCSIVAFRLAPSLDALSQGDEGARSIGLNTSQLRFQILALISILIGASLSCGGALPFIGLIAPHLARVITKPHFRIILPLAAIIGGILTVGADLIARTLRAPIDMDVGILTTILGAPYFLWLLFREDTK